MRIAVVTPIPTPYRDPFWGVVAEQPGVALHVFYCSAGKADRPWRVEWAQNFQSEVLPGRNLLKWRGPDAACFWNPGILQRLNDGQYDALVLGGYNHLTMLAAARWAVRHGVPYYLMCESYLDQPRAAWRRWIKGWLVRRVVSRATGGFPTGQRARDYLIHYGADPARLTLLPNVPDVVALQAEAERLAPQRQALRREHALPEGPIVLFAARLISKKRPELLVRAFARVAATTNATLVLVGDGPLRPALEALIGQLGLENRVRLAGFVQPAEMPTWYAMADLFVLPSSETWGVVVLEALASGLPVIITDQVGCGPDVLTDPALGKVVPAGDEKSLADALRERLEQDAVGKSVSAMSHSTGAAFSHRALANRMLGLLRGEAAAPGNHHAHESRIPGAVSKEVTGHA